MVWHLPILRSIAAQSADGRICLYTKESTKAAALFAGVDFIDHVAYVRPKDLHPITGGAAIGERLKSAGCSRVYVLHHSMRYHLGAYLSGAKERYGYGFGLGSLLLNRGPFLDRCQRPLNGRDRMAAFAQGMGLDCGKGGYHLAAGAIHRQFYTKTWGHLPRPWMTIGFGATEPSRTWEPAAFAACMTGLSAQYPTATFFLLGGPKEKARGARILTHLSTALRSRTVLSTDKPFEETVAILSLADFFLGNDSGLLNVSSVLGVPSFGLFGATPPLTYNDFLIPILPEDTRFKGGDHTSPMDGMAALAPDAVCAIITDRLRHGIERTVDA